MDITFREILNENGDSRVIKQFSSESFVPRVGDFVWLNDGDINLNENEGDIQSYRVMSVSIEYVTKRHVYVMVKKNKE